MYLYSHNKYGKVPDLSISVQIYYLFTRGYHLRTIPVYQVDGRSIGVKISLYCISAIYMVSKSC